MSTTGPESVESERADTAGGPVSPVTGRFHRARQIAQLWREEHPLTRAKLVVAMALHEAYLYVGDEHPGLRRRLDQSLAEMAKDLTAEQKEEVAMFASTLAKRSIASEADALAAIVRDTLK